MKRKIESAKLTANSIFGKKPTKLVVFALFLFTILRNGFAVYGEQIRGFGQGDKNWEISEITWHDPFRQIFLEFGKTFGYTSYILAYIISCLLVIFGISRIARKNNWNILAFYLYLTLLPGVTVVLTRFGSPDLFSLSFAILAGLTVARRVQILYLAGLVLSHIESSLLIFLCIYVISLKKEFRMELKRIFGELNRYLYFLFFTSAIIALELVTHGQNSRVDQFDDLLRISVLQFLTSGTWLIFSWMGGLWFIFLPYVRKLNKSQSLTHLLLVNMLGIFSIVTADGTRVAALMLTFYAAALVRTLIMEGNIETKWAVTGFLSPAIAISNFNVFLPFRQLIYLFGGNTVLTEIDLE